ncbi:MAG: hypothetical protein FWF06_05555 [Symbiobacteriaceae bacterium]|nr:hypothetical protein [Symbiobacteriaceae bacterium]
MENTIWHRLSKLDHRIIYLVYTIVVAFPLIFGLGLPLPITDDVRAAYEVIKGLPPGSIMYLGCDLGATNLAECKPPIVAICKFAYELGHKIVVSGFWVDGPSLAYIWMEPAMNEIGAVYGEDYVNLGYRASMSSILDQSRYSIIEAFSDRDINGNRLSEMPIFQNLAKASEFTYLVTINPGYPGTADYIRAWRSTGDVSLIIDVPTAGMITTNGTHLQAGLTQGMIGGLNGAAQFEALIGYPAKATASMDAQGVGIFIIIAFLVLGNISFIQLRKQNELTKGGS